MESLACGLPLCVFLFPAVSPMRDTTKDLPRAKRQYFSRSCYRFHIQLKLWLVRLLLTMLAPLTPEIGVSQCGTPPTEQRGPESDEVIQ